MTARLTPERLAEMERLCEAATAGPWEPDVAWTDRVDSWRVFMRGHENTQTNTRDCHLRECDARFIAAARNATADLLADLADARREAEELRQRKTLVEIATLRRDLARARAMLETLADTFDAAWRHRLPGHAGGQQVSFHGDFANIAVSVAHRMQWWSREIRECLAETAPTGGVDE